MLFPGPEQFLKIPLVKFSLSFLFLEYALNLNGTCSHVVIVRQFFKTQCVFEHLHHEFGVFIIVYSCTLENSSSKIRFNSC